MEYFAAAPTFTCSTATQAATRLMAPKKSCMRREALYYGNGQIPDPAGAIYSSFLFPAGDNP